MLSICWLFIPTSFTTTPIPHHAEVIRRCNCDVILDLVRRIICSGNSCKIIVINLVYKFVLLRGHFQRQVTGELLQNFVTRGLPCELILDEVKQSDEDNYRPFNDVSRIKAFLYWVGTMCVEIYML